MKEMKLKVNYNKKVVSKRNFYLPTGLVKKGDVFDLKDAYIEDDSIVMGVNTDYGVQEVGYKLPKGLRIKSREDVRNVVSGFYFPYFKNGTYVFDE